MNVSILRSIVLTPFVCLFLLCPDGLKAEAQTASDVNDDAQITLEDAILSLQLLTGTTPTPTLNKSADVNGDDRIGMEEVIYILQTVSGLRGDAGSSGNGDKGLSLDQAYQGEITSENFYESTYFFQINVIPDKSAHYKVTLLTPGLNNPDLGVYLDDGKYNNLDIDGKGGSGGELCVSADLTGGSNYQFQVKSDNTGAFQLLMEEGACTGKGGFSTCGSQSTFYAVAPMAPDSYEYIIPLGNLNTPGHTFPTVHTYLLLTDITKAVPVYAPGDVTIALVVSTYYVSTGITEYSLTFYSCAEVYGYYNHIAALTQDILDQIGLMTNCQYFDDVTGCSKEVFIEVSAGTQLGYAGGPESAEVYALDFGTRDKRADPIIFVNPDMLVSSDHQELYTVCPYDYYEEGTAKDNLTTKLKIARTADPICGTVDLDVADKARGKWYLVGGAWDSGWGSYEAKHMALVPSNYDPLVGVLSVGNPDVGTGAYFFDMESNGLIRRDFAGVSSDGNIYCYDTLRTRTDSLDTEGPGTGNSSPILGYLFLKMLSNTTLKIERVESGSCPDDPNILSFSASAVNFER